MRFSVLFAATSALALAACSEEPAGPETVEDPSDPDQVAAAVENLPTMQAGLYAETAELVEVELTGGTEEEREMFNSFFQPGSKQESETCRTEEEAAGGAEDFIQSLDELPDECAMDSFTVDGGTFEANLTCSGEAAEAGTVQIAGTMTESSSDVTMTMNMDNPDNDQSMRMVIRQQSERTGDCPAAG